VNVTATSIDISAPAAAVYELAAATARWPLILPHYRYVRVHARDGERQIVEMAAWRHIFPLRWVAEQINDPRRPHIAFRHIAGPTRGMDVEWIFQSFEEHTRVTIVHRLDFAFPVFAAFLGKYVVGDYFIAGVAARTLGCMKRLAETAAG
jgi:ribosome-associated toxin RatA of RatAB toxin-antitoxin module